MRRITSCAALCAVTILACTTDRRNVGGLETTAGDDGGGDGEGTAGSGSAGSGGESRGGGSGGDGDSGTSGGGDDSDGGGTSGNDSQGTGSGDDGGLRLDVGGGSGGQGNGGEEGDGMGCQKVDFLFVIDNSGSMSDEQQNLVNSFPGFISTIQSTLQARNYHIMVVDTDAEPSYGNSINCTNGVCTCSPEPECCYGFCNQAGPFGPPPPPEQLCGGARCDSYMLPTGCPVTLGAGKAEDPQFTDCGFVSGNRYMTDFEPDLNAAFTCAAVVGSGGDGNERPMQAMEEAVGPLNRAGECNEGFLRDDAILVVTFITDETEDGSPGTPDTWRQSLVEAKNGDENAVVVLGLVGHPGCEDDAVRLQQFADSFPRGQWGSVCAADYTPFFEAAVADIDAACDDFVPPG